MPGSSDTARKKSMNILTDILCITQTLTVQTAFGLPGSSDTARKERRALRVA